MVLERFLLTIDGRSTFHSSLAGMHRKSLEAADKLKDSDQSDADSKDHSEHSNASNPNKPTPDMNHLQSSLSKATGNCSPTTGSTSASLYNAVMSSNNKCNNKEDLRTSSIATLRAKAMEHSAKVQANTLGKVTEGNNLFSINQQSPHSHSPHSPHPFIHSSQPRPVY